jgi:hypothetical protein
MFINRNCGLLPFTKSIKYAFNLAIKSIIIGYNNNFIIILYAMAHGLLGISGIRVRP